MQIRKKKTIKLHARLYYESKDELNVHDKIWYTYLHIEEPLVLKTSIAIIQIHITAQISKNKKTRKLHEALAHARLYYENAEDE